MHVCVDKRSALLLFGFVFFFFFFYLAIYTCIRALYLSGNKNIRAQNNAIINAPYIFRIYLIRDA